MDFLGNISLRLVGLVATVITLGAVYLFIVKPVTDTTNNAFKSTNQAINQAFNSANPAIRQAARLSRRAKRQQARGQAVSNRALKRANCITRAAPDTAAMQRCAQRFPP